MCVDTWEQAAVPASSQETSIYRGESLANYAEKANESGRISSAFRETVLCSSRQEFRQLILEYAVSTLASWALIDELLRLDRLLQERR